MRRLNPGCLIGNDIVDLAEVGVAGKERDARFLARVFTAAERAQIFEDDSPALALWKTWAAKETAFKVAHKIREAVVFAHRAFEVAIQRTDEGLVRFEDLVVRVRWECGPGYVHCVGCSGSDLESGLSRIHADVADVRRALAGSLTRIERASVHSAASERVRLLAHTIIERWGVAEAEIVRRWRTSGWSAPIVAQRGRRVEGFDVSLSHDGRFVAAVVAGPGEARPRRVATTWRR